MKKLAIILAASALMVPVTAQAGHNSSNCGSSSTMSVNCEQGVRVYRVQPLQYAPGQLAALARADDAKAQQRKSERKLAMKSSKLKAQRKEIADLENRLERLEDRNNRRVRRSQSISGTGFGAGFLSPQRSPGFSNGLISGRGNRGGRGRGGSNRRHH